MLHYTVNTADTFDCTVKQFNPNALRILQPLVSQAIANNQVTEALPSPLNHYRVKLTVDDGAAMFDVLDPEGQLMATNAVAWTEHAQTVAWDLFEDVYLGLVRQFEMPATLRAPVMPDSLPWLATLVLPNPRISSAGWLADFEQCLALKIIQESKPKRKSRGFGR